MPRRLLPLLPLLTLLPACQTSLTRPTILDEHNVPLSQLHWPSSHPHLTLPLTPARGLLLTNAVRINGQNPGYFVLDTGAFSSCLDRATALQLGLTPDRRWFTTRHLKGPVDGVYRIPSFSLLPPDSPDTPLTLSNHAIGVVDLSSVRALLPKNLPLAGVIGGDVLSLAPFTLDPTTSTLTLHRRDAFQPPPHALLTRLKLIGSSAGLGPFARANPHLGQPAIPIYINDTRPPLTALLDTGQSVPLTLDPTLLPRRRRPAAATRPALTIAGAGNDVGLAGHKLYPARLTSLQFLHTRFTGPIPALLWDTPDRDHETSAILGLPRLRHYRLTFDYPTQTLWSEPLPRPST